MIKYIIIDFTYIVIYNRNWSFIYKNNSYETNGKEVFLEKVIEISISYYEK